VTLETDDHSGQDAGGKPHIRLIDAVLMTTNDGWHFQNHYMQTEAMAELTPPLIDASPISISTMLADTTTRRCCLTGLPAGLRPTWGSISLALTSLLVSRHDFEISGSDVSRQIRSDLIDNVAPVTWLGLLVQTRCRIPCAHAPLLPPAPIGVVF
jgi:hypothetical protein